jgi:hypothetical protein
VRAGSAFSAGLALALAAGSACTLDAVSPRDAGPTPDAAPACPDGVPVAITAGSTCARPRPAIQWAPAVQFTRLAADDMHPMADDRAGAIALAGTEYEVYFATRRWTAPNALLQSIGSVRVAWSGPTPELTSTPVRLALSPEGHSDGGCREELDPPQLRRDGREIMFRTSADCTERLLEQTQTATGGWPAAPNQLPVDGTDPYAAAILEDHQTLVFLNNNTFHLEYLVREAGGWSRGNRIETVGDRNWVLPYLRPSLSCDGWHLIYEASTTPTGDRPVLIAPITSASPVTLGMPEPYPLPDLSVAGVNSDDIGNIAESPDCEVLLFSDDRFHVTYASQRVH